MLSVVGLLIGFVSFVVATLIGLAVGIPAGVMTWRKHPKLKGFLFWLYGAVPALILWSILIGWQVHFSPAGGAPSKEDWGAFYMTMLLYPAIPGLAMFGGGLGQFIAMIFVKPS